MFLSLMTADAAAQHGHEFSTLHSTGSETMSSFSRLSWSLFSSVTRQRSSLQSPPSPATPKPNPTPIVIPAAEKPSMVASPAPVASDSAGIRPVGESRPGSAHSDASAGDRPRKRLPRSKTTYNLAHPPPPIVPRNKLHMRPRVLLQLQRVSASARPKPAFEVVPSAIFAPKLGRKFARVFKGRDRLGPDDMVVVRAEDYGLGGESESSDDERSSAREVIGVICVSRKEKDENGKCVRAEICMDDGLSWDAAVLPNGSYEFVATDEHGLSSKVRWLPRNVTSRRRSGTYQVRSQSDSTASADDDRKFAFSTMNPNTRRHPVIAWMSQTRIDISDFYTMPTASSLQPPSPAASPITSPESLLSEVTSYLDAADLSGERAPIKTDDSLRKLILVSGIWVAFREGWSAAFRNSSLSCSPITVLGGSSNRPTPPQRSVSTPIDPVGVNRTASMDFSESRRTIPRLFRSGTSMLHRNSNPSTSSSTNTTPTASPAPGRTRSRRANSTGTAFMQRQSSERSRRQKAKEDGLPESDNEVIRRRELTPLNEDMASSRKLDPPPLIITSGATEKSLPPTPTHNPGRSSRRDGVHSDYFASEVGAGYFGGDTSSDPRPSDLNGGAARPHSTIVVPGTSRERKRRGRLRRVLSIFKKGNGG